MLQSETIINQLSERRPIGICVGTFTLEMVVVGAPVPGNLKNLETKFFLTSDERDKPHHQL